VEPCLETVAYANGIRAAGTLHSQRPFSRRCRCIVMSPLPRAGRIAMAAAHAVHRVVQGDEMRRGSLLALSLLAVAGLCELWSGHGQTVLVQLESVPLRHPRFHAIDRKMPHLDPQSCIKAGATCTIRVLGGYLTLTDIAFPHGDSKSGSAKASGMIQGVHVHGMVSLKGNELPYPGHFVPAREDAEPHIAARKDASAGVRPGTVLDSQYSKAMRTIVGNLKRQNEKVDIAEDKISQAVEQVITSHAVSSSIANLALKVADERAAQADGNSFLDPKAQQLVLKAATSPKHQPSSTPLRTRGPTAAMRAGTGAGMQAVASQILAAKGNGDSGDGVELDKAGRSGLALPRSYPASGFPAQQTASRPWEEAMAQWQKEGIVATPSKRFPALHDSAAGAWGGLSALALEAITHNPAAGVAGPSAGSFAGEGVERGVGKKKNTAQCAACLVCYECCASGWIPGCGSYGDLCVCVRVCVCACVRERECPGSVSSLAEDFVCVCVCVCDAM
jgi:hypothetical protein